MSGANIIVSARLFSVAALFASTEPTRDYLRGVYVRPHPDGGAVLVATDGHRMVVIRDEAGNCNSPKIVSADKKLRAAITAADKSATVDVDADGFASVGGAAVVNAGTIDGTFPDYTRIICQVRDLHRSKQSGACTFNSTYLADLAKAAGILSDGRTNRKTLRIIAFGKGNPAIVNFPDCDHAFAVLMPIDYADDLNGLPAFLKPLVEGTGKRQ